MSAPVDAVVSGRWSDGQKIAVMCAVDADYKSHDMNGSDDLECPVCKMTTLKYRKEGVFNMTAWCSTCQTGAKQGNGAC